MRNFEKFSKSNQLTKDQRKKQPMPRPARGRAPTAMRGPEMPSLASPIDFELADVVLPKRTNLPVERLSLNRSQ